MFDPWGVLGALQTNIIPSGRTSNTGFPLPAAATGQFQGKIVASATPCGRRQSLSLFIAHLGFGSQKHQKPEIVRSHIAFFRQASRSPSGVTSPALLEGGGVTGTSAPPEGTSDSMRTNTGGNHQSSDVGPV